MTRALQHLLPKGPKSLLNKILLTALKQRADQNLPMIPKGELFAKNIKQVADFRGFTS
jgi:hypothetical protein